MNDRPHTPASGEDWTSLAADLKKELHRILDYWERIALDNQKGGFFGQVDQDNRILKDSPRGSVLNTRILWAFSAGYRSTGNPRWLELATHAAKYIGQNITDPEYGGLYWSVDADGNMLDGHKQVYAQAFGIYAMSEYYRASSATEALRHAIDWHRLIEKYSRDPAQGGYTEAFSRNWSYLEDKRLSPKDENASKTMNTHLHIVEAYANLYSVYPDENLKNDILDLLHIFNDKITNRENNHLGLFFSEDWQMDASLISYGHDIEAGWLLLSCAELTGDQDSIAIARKNALSITDAAMEGLDTDGGLWYEYNLKTGERINEKHWWPQAEALIGFYSAWQISGNDKYKIALLKTWDFIRSYILDTKHGEWFWGVDKNHIPLPGQDKVGIWKCPYHNTRACLLGWSLRREAIWA